MLIAMHVRNAMEDFRINNLSDTQMAELNKTIRQAVFDAIVLLEGATDPERTRTSTQLLAGLTVMIPDYWEIPVRGFPITAGGRWVGDDVD